MHCAAKILRADIKQCKKEQKSEQFTEISFAAAERIVPQTLFDFTTMLLSDKAGKKHQESGSHISDSSLLHPAIREKALVISQQLMQHVAAVPTPLSVATAYYVYNQTRSKSLITLNNRLGLGINYDTLQRQLTTKTINIMQQVEENGVFVPEAMVHNHASLHVYAMDNLDWKKNTLEGGTFNATTAIIIENPVMSSTLITHPDNISLPTSSLSRKKTLSGVSETNIPNCHISASDRRNSRSLCNIDDVNSLETASDETAEEMLLFWRLGRQVKTSQLLHVPYEGDPDLPGFSAFCAQLLPHHKASRIAYLPLIPASPTDPAVLKEEMTWLVQTSHALGDTWTVITGDQATYELAVAIRDKHKDEFSKVILLLGGFHQAHNYLKAVCTIMRDSGVEDLLVTAGMCQEGTAKKIFGEKADYYQSMHAIKILNEAVWHLYWEAFESWISEEDTRLWIDAIEAALKKQFDTSIDATEQLNSIQECHSQLVALQQHLLKFQETLTTLPTAVFWLNFLEMSDVLFRFIYHQREGPAKSLFEENYYELLKQALKPGGVICQQTESPWLFPDFLGNLGAICRRIYPEVRLAVASMPTYPCGEMGYLICSLHTKPLNEPQRVLTELQQQEMGLRFYTPEMHRAVFTLPSFAHKIFYGSNGSEEKPN
uniref:uncharacterized protein isoform X1 n=1 Tax=Myxine glutinosa TaxID=7769 RepID=UPI00358F52E3